MRLKKIFLYSLFDCGKALIPYYFVTISVYILLCILLSPAVLISSEGVRIGGIEISSVIFILIVGLNSFKETFHFGLVNGVSRKTQFLGFMCAVAALAAFMALVDTVVGLAFGGFVEFNSLYMQIYGKRYTAFPSGLSFQGLAEGYLWTFSVYTMVAMLGYCITLLYYRCNIIMKYVVSIIPILIVFFLFPALNNLTNGRFLSGLGQFLVWSMGFGQGVNPYMAVFSFLVGFGVLGFFSYLLIRRAVVKQ